MIRRNTASRIDVSGWQDARAMKAVISIARVWQVSFRRYLLYLANDSDRALQAMLRSHSPFAIRHSPIYLSHFAVARPAGQAAVSNGCKQLLHRP